MKMRFRQTLTIGSSAVVLGSLIMCANTQSIADDGPSTEGRPFDLRTQLTVSPKATLVRNAVIDCSTNPAYRKGTYGDYVASVVSPNHRNTLAADSCRNCHRNSKPSVGVGDRPSTAFATVSLASSSNKRERFSLYAGEKGQGKWVEFNLEPGKVQPFTWPYDDPRDRRSPCLWVLHDGAVQSLEPFATPNMNIGSLYTFATNGNDGKIHLSKAADQPYRKNRQNARIDWLPPSGDKALQRNDPFRLSTWSYQNALSHSLLAADAARFDSSARR